MKRIILSIFLVGQVVSAGRPNILFMFSDDHAPTAISAYGSKLIQTPNLDRIAREGVRFDRCLVTNSICGPSRAVVLTGKHSHLNGFKTNKDTFNGSQQTISKLMRKGGYQTAIIGKWHLKSAPTGFDHWEVLPGQGNYYNPGFKTAEGLRKYTGYCTDIITDLTLEWLENGRDESKPFFLMYHHKAPHGKWDPAPRHLSLFDDTTFPEPETLFDDYKNRSSAASNHAMGILKHMGDARLHLVPPRSINKEQLVDWNAAYGPKNRAMRKANYNEHDQTKWNYQRYIKDYLRVVTAVDENIGRMLEYLDKSGLSENTVVIYSSDQGFYLGEHGWFDKRWMYEPSLRTPLLIRWPGKVKKGGVSDEMVSNLDFAPTMLDVAGLSIPDDMQGRSFLPMLHGREIGDWRKSFYYRYYEGSGHNVAEHEGVRDERYKLIHFHTLNEWELFDLDRDPDEMRSEYNNPEFANVRKRLEAELVRLKRLYEVP